MRVVCWLMVVCHFPAWAAAEPWTLGAAIEHALSHNPDARVARHRVAASQAVIRQANAAFWPQLQLQSSYLWSDNPVNVFSAAMNQTVFAFGAFDLNDPPAADHLNARGLFTLPLYMGGALRAGRDAAREGAEAEQEMGAVVRAGIAFEVARHFHTLGKAVQLVHSIEAAVVSLEASSDVARRRVEAGTLLRSEALDVEVHLARARDELVRARNTEALVRRGLRNLLGLEQEDGVFLISESMPEVAPPSAQDAWTRPELEAARSKTRAAEAEVRRVRGGGRPSLSAFASYDHDRGWELGGSGNSWTAGGMLRWNLWDGRATRARVDEAQERLRAAEEGERKVRMTIDLEWAEAELRLKAARERLVATGKEVEQAEESLSTVRARFEQGRELAARLIDAESGLVRARVGRAEAEADERIAIAALRRAAGAPQIETASGSTE